ncbi:MAG TPA: carboxylesterase family protein [Candidatus Eisenbergiella stercoravium]|nr:carboxylesterase family protein [Candidatus Eisenbergiella stercoravium]
MLKIVKTENGLVRGLPAADPRVISFKGIPFAAPPVGELRWKAPQPAADWEGVRDCLEFAPISMQSIPGLDEENIYTREWNVDPSIPMSEDCLYLNVWTPAKSEKDRLPVFVWYFGGALQWGNTAEMEFDGERLARRGIVVVTVNYRLNVFGFLAHPELLEEAPDAPANFGNLDQQYGLFWTKRNIAAFGGDPDNITIGGQSAGGGSVLTQLNCEGNRGYIQKAIVESGIFLDPYQERMKLTKEQALEQGKRFFEYLGVRTLEEARALPAEFIRDKNDAFGAFWVTIPDGVYQTDTYWNNMAAGRFLDVPILTGYTEDEFLTKPQASNMEELKKEAKEKFGERAGEFLRLIQEKGGKSEKTFEETKRAAQIHSVELGIRRMHQLLVRSGAKQPMYVYSFGPHIPGWDNPGSFHSVDLWFFFETLAKCWRPFTGIHYDLARLMCNYWTEFIKKGNPDGRDADGTQMPVWDAFTEEEPMVMTFRGGAKEESRPEDEWMTFMKKHVKG